MHSCSASFCLNLISQKILWKKWDFKSFKEGNCSFVVTVWNTCAAAQSCQIFVTAWTVAHQDPLFIAFSRQEYWSVLPFPTPVSSPSRYQTCVSCMSCIGRRTLYPWHQPGSTEWKAEPKGRWMRESEWEKDGNLNRKKKYLQYPCKASVNEIMSNGK